MTSTRNGADYTQRFGSCVVVAARIARRCAPGQTAVRSDLRLSQSRRVVSKKGLEKTVTRHEGHPVHVLQRWVLA